MVYDITNRESFEECKNYYNIKLKEKCKKDIKVILLGNKTDLEDQRKVSSEEGAGFSLENDYIFMETSCLQNKNVASAFETLIELTNREEQKKQVKKKNFQLKEEKSKKNKCLCPLFN